MRTAALLALLCYGCKDDTPADDTAVSPADDSAADPLDSDSCDPIIPDHCGMPFPSTYHMVEDSSTATGFRVAIGPSTLPIDIDGYQPDPRYWNEYDGFSPVSTLVVLWPDASDAGAIPLTDIGAYADADAHSVIVDVDTGALHPHWVELDMTHDNDERRVLMLRPAVPFENGHRYAVGMRGFVDNSGTAIEPSEGMAALIAGEQTGDARIDDRRALYDDTIFPALEGAGWERSEVQVAWDFVVSSREKLTERALWMRDDALDRIGAGGPGYVIDEVEEGYNEFFGLVIHGTMTVPLYADSDRAPALLTRDEDGMPYYNGDVQVPFVVAVPQSLLDDPRPAPIVQYGHGFFGDQEEVYKSWNEANSQLASDNGWIFYGANWTGMDERDLGQAELMLATDIESFAALPERTMQGFIEFVCLARLMQGDFVRDAWVQATDPDSGEAFSLIDTSRHWYYGISQGAILGTAYVALSPDIHRAAFSVGGMSYTLMTTRSSHFDPDFFMLFRTFWPDEADIMFWLSALQTLWDTGDGSGYATGYADPFEGSGAKQVLMQNGIGDAQVPTVTGHLEARAIGAALIDEPAREVWGLDTQPSGWTGNAYVEWDDGATEELSNNPSPEETDAHEVPRDSLAGQAQLAHFFETGEVVNYCDGPCDPE